MTVTIKVEGELKDTIEPIDCEIEVPEDWTPSWETFCKVRGTLLTMMDAMQKSFAPKPEKN